MPEVNIELIDLYWKVGQTISREIDAAVARHTATLDFVQHGPWTSLTVTSPIPRTSLRSSLRTGQGLLLSHLLLKMTKLGDLSIHETETTWVGRVRWREGK